MTRAPRGDGVTCVTGCQFSRRKKRKINKKLKRNIVDHVGTGFTHPVPLTKVEELVDTSKYAMVVNLSVSSVAENSSSENVVLRSLLRGPRYFDPPDKSWGACFNCGEEGHSTVNCTSARRKKPCFICGSLEHEVKQCQKGQDCFLCKEKGHRAKDCPQKMKRCSLVSEFCLRCGASAHVMNSCNNDYLPDDLKDIQCYVCKRFGHLCCTNYCDVLASEASCHKCGHTGHYGTAQAQEGACLLVVHQVRALSVGKEGISHMSTRLLARLRKGRVTHQLQQGRSAPKTKK